VGQHSVVLRSILEIPADKEILIAYGSKFPLKQVLKRAQTKLKAKAKAK
jgi:hypothetical protein